MMSRNLLLVAVTGALTGWLPQAAAQQKHVVLSNVDGVAGQAQVAGKAAIPLTGNAQVDAQGNIVVTCQKGTPAGVGVNDCSNVGTGSTGALTSPGITFNGPSAVVAATETTARLHWTTSNAHACYGVAPVLSGWNKEWATSTTGSTGFQVGNLTRHATDQTSYTFTLRCYSNVDATVGNTDVVAYTDTSHTVTLAPSSGGGGTSGSCDTYLASLGEIGDQGPRDHFEAHRAENRKNSANQSYNFTRLEKTYFAQTSKTLGVDTGQIGPTAFPYLPGILGDTQYLALTFSLPVANETNSGKFAMDNRSAIGAGKEHHVVMAISPCPGDFRPRDNSSTDIYLKAFCRSSYSQQFVLKGNSNLADTTSCPIPTGQTMYLNISLRNHSLAVGQDIPADLCNTGQYCGTSSHLSN